MTLETLNLLLALGGSAVVPAAVGLTATYLVHRQEKDGSHVRRANLEYLDQQEHTAESRLLDA